MARLVATNFTGGLQFPYATAAADLFHKEDVQTLALAVDQHDHSSGKGVVIPASAIPPITSAMILDGTITSADIADGTIQTVDIAASAVQEVLGGYLSAPSFSTTTTNAWVPTPVAFTTPSLPAGAALRVECNYTILHGVTAAGFYMGFTWNGSFPGINLVFHNQYVAGYAIPGCIVTYFTVVAAGPQTFALSVFNGTAGALTLHSSVTHALYVTYQKR